MNNSEKEIDKFLKKLIKYIDDVSGCKLILIEPRSHSQNR